MPPRALVAPSFVLGRRFDYTGISRDRSRAHALHGLFRERTLESSEMKLYVSNLPYNTSEESLRKLFSRHGQVQGIWIGNTRLGSPHGYGFVHMPDGANAKNAISKLDGIQFEGSEINVHQARD